MRDQVFISYSHRDKKWLGRLQTALAPYIRTGLNVWDDTRIKPGAAWRDEIGIALSRAKVAILLVTPHFLASEFIHNEELPPLLDAAQRAGLVVLWIAISASASGTTKIATYQAVNDPSKPLDKLRRHADINEALVQVCTVVDEAFRRQPEQRPTDTASTRISAHKFLVQPTEDRLIARLVEVVRRTKGGLIIPEHAMEPPIEGFVMAVGPDVVRAKVGDRILWGKYCGMQLKIDGKEHILLRESDVVAIIG